MADPTEALDPARPNPQPSEPTDARDLSGKTLGDFRVLRRLGQGGMGQVYLAEQLSLKRNVALKLLKPELSANKTSLERFKREAEAVARVSHANIVHIHAVGETEGLHYMALEYVEGRNLREFVEKKGPPELPLAVRIMTQIAAALQQASELGIVHRDIKPENILVNRKGDVKVADFGLSRHFKRESNLTESRIAMGTPLYMSPEQVEGKPVDHRSDLYSFGVTCYYLLTGAPPFQGQSPFEVALQHVQREPAPLGELRPDLPIDLCRLVHRLMAKAPDQRYQTGREVLRDLQRLREGLAISAVSAPLALDGLTPSGTILAIGGSAEWEMRRRPGPRRWRFACLALVALAAGGAAGWFWTPPRTVLTPLPEKPPEGRAQETPLAIRELFDPREREKELARRVSEALKSPLPFNPADRQQPVEAALELGALYLRERKLDAADELFKELDRFDRRVPVYRTVALFGQAMTLAHRDQAAESLARFAEALVTAEKAEALVGKFIDPKNKTNRQPFGFWRHHFGWREQIAEALERDRANQNVPALADPRLETLRRPPVPEPKAPVRTPPG